MSVTRLVFFFFLIMLVIFSQSISLKLTELSFACAYNLLYSIFCHFTNFFFLVIIYGFFFFKEKSTLDERENYYQD